MKKSAVLNDIQSRNYPEGCVDVEYLGRSMKAPIVEDDPRCEAEMEIKTIQNFLCL